MTIVAGFHCSDGIVLCADTQENVGDYIKRNVSKIEARPRLLGMRNQIPCAVFAGAGDGDFIDYIVEKLWAAMEPKGGDLKAMIEAAEDELISQYQRLVPVHPNGMPDASFLIAVWAAPREMSLLKINGPIVKRDVDFDAIGFGDILVTYIASRLLHIKTFLDEAVPVSIYMVDEAKQHVTECGGETHVVTLDEEGKFRRYSQDAIKTRTRELRDTDRIAREIVGLSLNEHLPLPSYKTLADDIFKRLLKIREGTSGREDADKPKAS